MAVDKRNIFLTNTVDEMPYVSGSRPGKKNFPIRNVSSHSNFIQNKLQQCYANDLSQKQVAAIRYKEGVYLEFSSAPEHDLAIKSLENRQQGIRLLNVRKDEETNTIKATVYIPGGKESYFLKKVEEYADELKLTPTGNPKNNDLISSIEDVRLAILDSFWIGALDTIPTSQPEWCELWLRYDCDRDDEQWNASEDDITRICNENQIAIDSKHIIFPERIVKMVYANSEQLKLLIGACSYITEMRRAQEATSFFESLANSEQKEWVDELLARVTYQNSGVAICLLDTGVTASHPLLDKAMDLSHVQSVNSAWGSGDHQGHGTEMAGISLFYDVKHALISNSTISVSHEIESVKILPPVGENVPELYGAITEQAVSLAEIANPTAKRVICMAVTSPCYNTFDGSPTSWSASIDNITSGANEENEKRLFIISAGNVYPGEFGEIPYPDVNTLHCVESPGQSWNAITVGAYSDDIQIDDPSFRGFQPVAPIGAISPYSSTSEVWESKWPIKPEVLFNGGNMATNGTDFSECPDLSMLTTNYRPLSKQFSTIWGTSSAAAQASWFCSKLLEEYPDIWPETVRALMIHSAEWTDTMKHQFCIEDTKTKGRHRLLRTCGYGIPNLYRAIQCIENSVNMVAQGELQPYGKKSMKDMHIHTLPWPKELLRELGDVPVKVKVTLSYYIEPGPGEVGWKDKYRYSSCGLRFDMINSDESLDDFKKRINIKMRGEDKTDNGDGTSGSDRWFLGSKNRDVGSIHSDFCELSAVELCECNRIAIYPVVGWWRERDYLGKYDSTIRYSMVITISTPKVDVDFYTPIITEIGNVVEIDIPSNF
ncbi:S8 family peptidase [Anaerocolumna sp. AGMB13020]|uniref:S8 family peptidase n=1 Tax=Anaerocolumna sp. AGMB13020 TaxID=3081750 RepID=UPI002952E90F|nr:S8 family peptidase [Anaerocolumna sp. AGMB13020]WOO35116.1 S8 family peptidase [Anaerocolumna sp. AGMB13020]